MLDKAIIFDLDGTLWDTSIEIEQVWKEVAENYNIKINQEKIRQIMGFTKDEIIEYLFKENSEEGICRNKKWQTIKNSNLWRRKL